MIVFSRKRSWKSRPGVLLPVVGVLLVALLSMTALVIDGGMIMADRRLAQGAADAAALAGSAQLYARYPVYHGVDVLGDAKSAALALARDNGYNNDTLPNTVKVNIPPTSGTYLGKAGYVEVIVTASQTRIFSGVFGSGNLQISARAVAIGMWVPVPTGMIVLDPTDSGALSLKGNGGLTMTGAPVVVNSNSPSALTAVGNGGITAPQVYITGGSSLKGNGGITATTYTGAHPVPDPLAFLPAPGQPGAPAIPPAGTIITTSGHGGATQYDIYPGSYASFPSFTNKDTVIFHQAGLNPYGGIYYITGGLDTHSATLMMAAGETGGMMIYLASGPITINGNNNGSVNLSPLTNGPYKGMLLFQARNDASDVTVNGNGTFNLGGTFYVPDGSIKFTGNGDVTMTNTQVIVNNAVLSGNGTVNISYTGNGVPTRKIQLVE